MYCSKCGAEIGDAKFCPICGAKQEGGSGAFTVNSVPQGDKDFFAGIPEEQPSYGRVSAYLKEMYSSTMFMVLAILVSVSALLGSMSYSSGKLKFGVSIIGILIAVSLWITYASAKGSSGLQPGGPSFTSGVLKAYTILNWVGMGFLAVGGILCIAATPMIAQFLPGIISEFSPQELEELQEFFRQLPGEFGNLDIQKLTTFALVGLGIALLIGAVVILVINLCFIRKLHLFAKSVCNSLKTDEFRIVKARACKNWLIVSAVFSLLGGGLSVLSFRNLALGAGTYASLSSLCSAAACILASMMIKKYFIESGIDRQ